MPEDRQISPTLTVHENLVASAACRPRDADPWTMDRVLALFPALAAQLRTKGALLSGGEQQMLAIGRALMTNPIGLVLYEATEGLAPLVRGEIWRCLESPKATQIAVLVIDKNVDALSRIAQRDYILEKGRNAWAGISSALLDDATLRQAYLAV